MNYEPSLMRVVLIQNITIVISPCVYNIIRLNDIRYSWKKGTSLHTCGKGFFSNRGAYKLEMHPRFVLKIDRGINISNVSFIAFCSLRMDSYDFGDALKHMVSFSHNLVLFGHCLLFFENGLIRLW